MNRHKSQSSAAADAPAEEATEPAMTVGTSAEPPFEKAMAELEQVVEQLEGGQASLQDSLRLFARGVELVRVCQKQLDVAAEQVRQLLEQDDGQVVAVPFQPELSGAGTTGGRQQPRQQPNPRGGPETAAE